MSLKIKSALITLALLLASCIPPEASSAPRPPNAFDFILQTVMFVLMGALIYYMLVTKPQIQKEDQQKEFFDGLKKGDEVVLSSGIFGKIMSKKDNAVMVEIAKDVRVRVRAQNVQPIGGQTEEKPPVEKKKAAKG